ncbi:MAG: hypothetical protein JO122_15565 [Acetobacteraceae bacterium]|nr:hypothetical protein [Acetobacteraceae bacterium]
MERTPGLPEIFVVGRNSIWLLADNGTTWTTREIAPTAGQVASDSPIAAVATSSNNLDIFYLNGSRVLQHLRWTNEIPEKWDFDADIPHLTAPMGMVRLSAVSRTPDNIDVVMPCDPGGSCTVSISNANNFPDMPVDRAPAISSLGWNASSPSLSLLRRVPRST